MYLLLLIALLTWHAVDINAPTVPRQYCGNTTMIEESTAAVFRSERKFALSLYKSVAANLSSKSMAVSCAATFLGLSKLRYGALGETEQELCDCLKVDCKYCLKDQYGYQRLADRINSVESKGVRFRSQIWYQYGLEPKPKFEKIMNMTFRAKIRKLEKGSIDKWYRNETGLPTDLFRKVGDFERENPAFVLTDAGYLKGSWTKSFSNCVAKLPFFPDDGPMEYVQKGLHKIGKFNHGAIRSATFVEIKQRVKSSPKEANNTTNQSKILLSIFIILPNNGTRLDTLEREINDRTLLEEIFKGGKEEKLRLIIPDFRWLQGNLELDNILSSLGAKKMFTDDAELTGITDKRPARVYKILHKAVIRTGNPRSRSHSTADCAPKSETPSGDDNVPEFRANRSFMMIIGIKSEPSVVLFMARFTGHN